ncbi:MAG: hypothetical protein KAV82_11640 [Phycisphaerae bacterium]|nr:hypothetical protein [Phycisphaerae bacterium]
MTKQGSYLTLIVALLALPACALAGPGAQPFTLGKFVPHDCWMMIHGTHDPERAFIEAHWARVLEEVKKSGIDVETRQLLGSYMADTERAEFETAWNAAVELVKGVRWGELIAKELVFAERMGGITPDIILLCRSSPESVKHNVQGLKAILDTMASLGENVSVTEQTTDGAVVWNLGSAGWPISLHLFNKGDVVGIVLGQQALNDVLALMGGKKGAKTLVNSPRFQKAASELPAPESALMFFDFQMHIRDMNRMFELVFSQASAAGKHPGENAPGAIRFIRKVFDQINFLDYSMVVTRTEGLQEITLSTLCLRTDALDQPLCRMLTDRKPFRKFDRFIPKNAGGFSVSTFVDLQKLHEVVLDFIRTEAPDGPALLTAWANLQRELDFDIETDLFSWWSGETVRVTLPPAIKGPFASEDFAWFIRVKDAKLAKAKVNAGIDRLAALFREHDQMLMLSEANEVNAEGFRSITHPVVAIYGLNLIVGVADGHLVVGNSAACINACLATAAGKAPSIVEDARFKSEGLLPDGPVCSASFRDLRNLGQEWGTAFFMMGMAGQIIPDEPDTKSLKAIIQMLGRLSTAINQIDFLNSSAAVCTFDGRKWATREVLNYKRMENGELRMEKGEKPSVEPHGSVSRR